MNFITGARAVFYSAVLIALAPAGQTFAQEKVKVAILGGASDAGIFVSLGKGWFKEAGLDVETIRMDSGARMIGPMSTGEIDVGTGVVSAGFYNAVLRGIKVKVLASKARNVKGQSYQSITVRKDLMDSGAVKSLKDLVGRRFALVAPGATDGPTLSEAMAMVGKTYDDVTIVYLGFPAQVASYERKGIDASMLPEPFRTQAIAKGLVRELITIGEIRNNQEVGVITYSEKFSTQRTAVAQKFMNAYVRGIRFYDGAIVNGRLTGKNAAEVIEIFSRYSTLKDKKLLASIVPTAIDPDGQINLKSFEADYAFYRARGMVKGEVNVAGIIDRRFIDQAIKDMGPYKKQQ